MSRPQKSADGTAFPYYVIIDPTLGGKQASRIASAITGIWFTREAAEKYLQEHDYNFGPKAQVYCLSGEESTEWRALVEGSQ